MVVLIIGILAAIAVPQYQKAVNKSRVVQAQVILDALSKANSAYSLESGQDYSPAFDSLVLDFPLTGIIDYAGGQCGFLKNYRVCLYDDAHGKRLSVSMYKNKVYTDANIIVGLNEFVAGPKNGYIHYCVSYDLAGTAMCKSLGYEEKTGVYSFGGSRTSLVK